MLIQIGLRNELIREYATEAILEIIDMREFVLTQYNHVKHGNIDNLTTPLETVYTTGARESENIALDRWEELC